MAFAPHFIKEIPPWRARILSSCPRGPSCHEVLRRGDEFFVVTRATTCTLVLFFRSFLVSYSFLFLSFSSLPVSLSHVFFLSFSFLRARTFDGIVFPANFPRRYEKDGDFTRESIDRAPHIDENDACNESFIPTEVTSPQSLPPSLFCILVLI